MKKVLNDPSIYHFVQTVCGFFSARIKAISEYLELRPGQRIIDIGCGPGHIVSRLPKGIIYHGFDVDQRYIDFANLRFGDKGTFHCQIFDESAARQFGPADVVLMNGVLHHMDDDAIRAVSSAITRALRPNGVFFALDGVFCPEQSAAARWLLRNDRGEFVRTEEGYQQLLSPMFASCDFHVRHDLVRVPYSLIISRCWKASASDTLHEKMQEHAEGRV